MSEYIKQAEKFATDFGVKLTVLNSEYKKHFSSDTEKRYVFKLRLSRGRKCYTFDFGQSIAEGSNEPDLYSVLACFTKYDVGSYENFCGEFGYDEFDENTGRRNKKTFKTYKAVCREYEAVERLFSDCIDQLQDIQ